MRESHLVTKWVNSDRQLADVLTKPQVPAHMIQHLLQTGEWKIVFDKDFTSAKKLRREARDAQLKANTQTSQQRALTRSIGTSEKGRSHSGSTPISDRKANRAVGKR